ncbi:hypothetical protein DXG01_006553 [Tephrocybe rancida]|nr:hypothetical protein DXG01_006553 [Tephrocybe rancida]
MIFAVLTTISVSPSARKQLTKTAAPSTTESTSHSPPSGVAPGLEDTLDNDPEPLVAEPETNEGEVTDLESHSVPIDIGPEAEAEVLDSGVPPGLKRDPWLGATVSILALLFLRYHYAVVFPTFLGVFLFTCNANRDIFAVMSRLGLSIAYSSVLASLHTLSADSDRCLRTLGALIELRGPRFLILFDNVNKMQRAWEPTISHGDEVKSGTAGTAIELEDIPEDAMRAEPLLHNIKKNLRTTLTVKKLYDDIDWPHIHGIGASRVLHVWTKHISGLAKFRGAVNDRFAVTHLKHPLRLRKSKIHPMRTTDIDESTTAGVASVLYNLVIGQLGVVASLLGGAWLVLVCGDQLSIDRIRKVKRYSAKEEGYHSHQWAVPVIQIWHMKWALQKCIFRLHWWGEVGKEIFGLRHDCELLTRGKFNAEKCDFYPAHHILEDRFDAMLLDALRILCEEQSHTFEPTVSLLEGLEGLFSIEGPLSGISFEVLVTMAEAAYTRYMCNAAYESALGHGNRDPAVYGQPATPVAHSTAANEVTAPANPIPDARKPKKRSNKQARAKEQENFSHGDQTLATNVHFLRITCWYLEMCAATAEGDIGRVFEIIKLLRFSFWGAGSTNYGNELLELACNFMFEFPDLLKTAVLNNYLVNPSGRKGHWLELDLLQEHFNFWIKRLFNSKSHDFDARHLSEAVSLNISGFSMLRDRFPALFGAKRNSPNHANADKQGDINRLGFHFRLDKILAYIPNRVQAYLVNDEFARGYDILVAGQLQVFIERTSRDGTHMNSDMNSEPEQDTGASISAQAPANPITSDGGIMGITPFNGEDNSSY